MVTIHTDSIVDNPSGLPSIAPFTPRDQQVPIERAYVFTDREEYDQWISQCGGLGESVHQATLIIIGDKVIKNRYTSVGIITSPPWGELLS